MAASHHGYRVGLHALRQRFPVSLRGANVSRLIALGGELGFQCRPLRLELDDLSKLTLPCILQWDLNHYVVLAKVGRGKATIHDPAVGNAHCK